MSSDEQIHRDWEPQTSAEHSMSKQCDDQYCYNEVYEEALTPVSVGQHTKYICPECVESHFGLDISNIDTGIQPTKYITPSTVAAFLTGTLLTAILFSMLVV